MTHKATCIFCEEDSNRVPLIAFQFQGSRMWICPQHLPVLIHKPAQLAHKLPGLENLEPPKGHGSSHH